MVLPIDYIDPEKTKLNSLNYTYFRDMLICFEN